MEIYKKGQGTAARWVAGISLGAMAAFGCFELEEMVRARLGDRSLNLGIEVAWSVLVSSAIFIAAAVGVGLLVNSKRAVDYLISSEIELRKVSWPTRVELKRQTAVVLVTIAFFAVLLLLADMLFALGSGKLYGF